MQKIFTYHKGRLEPAEPQIVSEFPLKLIVNGREIGGSSGVSRALLDKDENQVIIGPATSRYIFLLRKNII